ncbi:MAG: phosphatase PAP2 family protein [Atopobiaceae bacterium]|jgi:undecaprenyl-diphosphatase|nr:phosphatase PAP2 family protein [Atopobiaceae bacterium]MCH4119045.1 phosphatase PAP2 family protein [Atopobiaceae bacterium]MCI1318432.1 phosphatase PAP2 family protein [Atopobiaceae bacterium]MCI1389523.1 phosphatase PAP2 family protein [Atopobiaceae bacterium]MCI1432196.1 phosphatase PAP2 family protein [Atopobiaceae bacterium]
MASALAPAPCLVAVVLLFLWLLGKGHADRLGLLVLQGTSLAGVGILNLCLKAAFARPRPEVALVAETGLSFPSGHSMLCMAAYGLLAIVATRRLRTERAKYAASMAAGIAIALMGASRVLLGIQYPRTCSTASWCRLHGF